MITETYIPTGPEAHLATSNQEWQYVLDDTFS